jgi:tetratricopeptide (TPR) repeat protein
VTIGSSVQVNCKKPLIKEQLFATHYVTTGAYMRWANRPAWQFVGTAIGVLTLVVGLAQTDPIWILYISPFIIVLCTIPFISPIAQKLGVLPQILISAIFLIACTYSGVVLWQNGPRLAEILVLVNGGLVFIVHCIFVLFFWGNKAILHTVSGASRNSVIALRRSTRRIYKYVLVLFIVSMLVNAYLYYNYTQEDPEKVTVFVADFDNGTNGSDGYAFAETIRKELTNSLGEYDEIEIVHWPYLITEKEGSGSYIERAKWQKASILIWGWYRTTQTSAQVSVNIEDLRGIMPTFVVNPVNCDKESAIPLANLDSFSVQLGIADQAKLIGLIASSRLLAQSERHVEAINRLDKAISDPITPEAEKYMLFVRARSLFALSRHREAIKDLDRVISLDPNFTSAYVNRGTIFVLDGKVDEAWHDLEKAKLLGSNEFIVYLSRSYIAFAQNNLPKSIQEIDASLQSNIAPEYVDDVLIMRGIIRVIQGDESNAIADFTKAIAISDNIAEAYYQRGSAYHHFGKMELAISDFVKSLNYDKNNGNAYYQLGLINQNRNSEYAITFYTNAIEQDSNLPCSYLNRGILRAGNGDREAGINDISKAIEIMPDFANAYSARGLNYFANGQFDQAIDDFNRVIELKEDDLNAYFYRGASHYYAGNKQAALEDLVWFAQSNKDEELQKMAIDIILKIAADANAQDN